MGPRRCELCGSDSHTMLKCPQLPIVRLGRAEAPIVGFRAWKPRFANGSVRLTSLYKDAPWNASRPTRAVCDFRYKHMAPALRCTCGLYACYTLRGAALNVDSEDAVFGATVGWGRIYLHENGWRAQHAQVLCLTSLGRATRAELDVCAAAGLRLIPADAVESYAAEFGCDGEALYQAGDGGGGT